MGPDTVRARRARRGLFCGPTANVWISARMPSGITRCVIVAWRRQAFVRAGFPVISVDTKQRELVGNFKNPGRTWRRKPLEVSTSDYPSDAKGVAIPYGIYDVGRNEGYVVVGTSHQTPQFAISAICRWWRVQGSQTLSAQASHSDRGRQWGSQRVSKRDAAWGRAAALG